MALGGQGVISVAGNEVPHEMAQLVELCEQGDYVAARALHERLLPLLQANFIESSPIPVKAVMAMAGLLTLTYRLPMVPPTEATLARLRDVAAPLGLVLQELA